MIYNIWYINVIDSDKDIEDKKKLETFADLKKAQSFCLKEVIKILTRDDIKVFADSDYLSYFSEIYIIKSRRDNSVSYMIDNGENKFLIVELEEVND